MPLPALVIWGAVAAASAFGVGKTVKAVKDNKKASYYGDRANEIISNASAEADESRKEANSSLESLGKVKLRTADHTVGSFLSAFGKIKNIRFSDVDTLSESKNLDLDTANIAELSKMSALAISVLNGTVSGTLSGAVAAYGAYSAVGWVASASTGTAISGLSGAAATNATLAWLGGGTIAAGGGGVAAGTLVLGGIVTAPALLILGCVLGSKASTRLDDAKANLAKAQDYAEQMKLLCLTCKKISERADFMCEIISTLAKSCDQGVNKLEKTIDEYGTDWNCFPQEAKNEVAMLGAAMKLLKTLLNKKILTKDGEPSDESDPARIKQDYPDLVKNTLNECGQNS